MLKRALQSIKNFFINTTVNKAIFTALGGATGALGTLFQAPWAGKISTQMNIILAGITFVSSGPLYVLRKHGEVIKKNDEDFEQADITKSNPTSKTTTKQLLNIVGNAEEIKSVRNDIIEKIEKDKNIAYERLVKAEVCAATLLFITIAISLSRLRCFDSNSEEDAECRMTKNAVWTTLPIAGIVGMVAHVWTGHELNKTRSMIFDFATSIANKRYNSRDIDHESEPESSSAEESKGLDGEHDRSRKPMSAEKRQDLEDRHKAPKSAKLKKHKKPENRPKRARSLSLFLPSPAVTVAASSVSLPKSNAAIPQPQEVLAI